jgi:tRNA A-37 threonylcarbamoyl transferase component Bud32
VIVLEKCGDRISKQELLTMMDVIRNQFKEIHALGVVQGDVARRNILLHHKGVRVLLTLVTPS